MSINQSTIDNIIRIGLIALIIAWSIMIIAPFVGVLLWGIIIAVSAYPSFVWLVGKLGGRAGLASCIFVLLMLAFIIGPIGGSIPGFTDSVRDIAGERCTADHAALNRQCPTGRIPMSATFLGGNVAANRPTRTRPSASSACA